MQFAAHGRLCGRGAIKRAVLVLSDCASYDEDMNTVKIRFELDIDEDGWPPIKVETLHAKPLDDGTFEIANTPFFIGGTAFGDVVEARASGDGRLEFAACVKESNYRAISIILFSPDMRQLLIDELQGKECIIEYGEFSGMKMLAIAIPHTTDYVPIQEFFDAHENGEKLSYAELVG